MATTDNRKYPRLDAEFPVQIEHGGATIREHGFSLGGGGIFVNTPKPLSAGAEVGVRFRPAKHLPLIQAKAKVCYAAPAKGMALEFTDIGPDDQRRLLGYIHNRRESTRKHPRAPLATQIESPEAMLLAFSKEISVGGMFIETNRPLPIGSRITLRFNLGETGDAIVQMAEVSYHAGKLGIGVRFVEPTPDDIQRIQSYVAEAADVALPKPKKVKR